jgi:hypothetical protein
MCGLNLGEKCPFLLFLTKIMDGMKLIDHGMFARTDRQTDARGYNMICPKLFRAYKKYPNRAKHQQEFFKACLICLIHNVLSKI